MEATNKSTIKTITLNNGLQMPLSGLGTYNVKDPEVYYQAVKRGVRLFDTAQFYENEKAIGEGLARAIKDGLVKREELFIVTKLWMTDYENPESRIRIQLKDLQMDYVDLYLLHWPLRVHNKETNEFQKIPTHKLWASLEDLVKKGLTKSIGVSNFNVQILIDMLTYCEIKPAVNQFELHPYYQRKGLVDFHKKFGIHIMAYGSFVRGVYTEVHTNKGTLYDLSKEEAIVNLAEKHKTSEMAVALSWASSNGITVIPKSNNPDRIKSNYDAVNLVLSADELKELQKLDINKRFCDAIDSFDGLGAVDIFA